MPRDESKRQRGRPGTISAEDVLTVAVTTYWHEGPEVSLNDVCQRAGVSKPSVYREFGNEDRLSAAALEHYTGMVQSQLRDLLSSKLSFADKLNAIITFASEDPRNGHGCLFVKMRAARRHLGPKTQTRVAEIEAAAVDISSRFFLKSQENGEWSDNIRPDFEAQYLHAQIGLAASQRATGAKPALAKPLMEYALSVLQGQIRISWTNGLVL